MAAPNVMQHVVPRFYLDQFAGADGKVRFRQSGQAGKIGKTRAENLCKERHAFTVQSMGASLDAGDGLNQRFESACAKPLKALAIAPGQPGEPVGPADVRGLTMLAANLAARSVRARELFDEPLGELCRFAKGNPDFGIPDFGKLIHAHDSRWQEFLSDPATCPDFCAAHPDVARLRPLLQAADASEPGGLAEGWDEPFRRLAATHYPMLLAARTAAIRDGMDRAMGGVELLIASDVRFITADEPALFVHPDGARPPSADVFGVWSGAVREVYLPLAPGVAARWSTHPGSERQAVTAEAVREWNALMRQNARQFTFAADEADLPA